MECASCKVRNLSNCTARKSAKFAGRRNPGNTYTVGQSQLQRPRPKRLHICKKRGQNSTTILLLRWLLFLYKQRDCLHRREIILKEANPMSCVFQNIDPPPTHRPANVTVYPFGAGGEDTLAGWKGGGGSIFWKTPDTALYSTHKYFVVCTFHFFLFLLYR